MCLPETPITSNMSAAQVIHDFGTPVWRVSWSVFGNILAVSDSKNSVTLWKESIDGHWDQLAS